MSTDIPGLSATIAYLRFPLRAEHRGGLCDGSACPHCDGTCIQKWGHFAGRQRFRCRDCRRTFSCFTGTPLRYLKRVERWRTFLWCLEGRLTVRQCGVVVGIDKNTALRWRHRALDQWRCEPQRRMRGRVAIGEFSIPLNEKGTRRLGRRPRRHGHAPGRATVDLVRIGLIAAIETDAKGAPALMIRSTDVWPPGRSDYERILGARFSHVDEIAGSQGRLCPVAGFAGSVGIAYRTERGGDRAKCVWCLRSDLRRWLRPLRGVATSRLDNYLEWFRRDPWVPRGRDVWRAAAFPTVAADRARGCESEGSLPPSARGTIRAESNVEDFR